ncbi:hypothetical protein LPJ66_011423, partial [Kickxella alabastrina]
MNHYQQVIRQAHNTLAAAQDAMTAQVNHNCCDIQFKAGDLIMISASMINSDYECNCPSAKLSDCWLGLYKILEALSSVTYHTELPPNYTYEIHLITVHANWVLNRLPKHALGMSTPFEKLDSNSNIANIHPFGCLDWSEYPPELRSKFGECAQKCVYLSSKDGKALLYRMDTDHVLHTSRAKFVDAEFPFYSESAPFVAFYFHESDMANMANMATMHGPICIADMFDEDNDQHLAQLQEED